MRVNYSVIYLPANATEEAAVPTGALVIKSGETEVKFKSAGGIESVATSSTVAGAVATIAIKDWQGATAMTLNEVRRATATAGTIELGDLIRSNSARTTGAAFDATEAGNWTEFAPDIVTSVATRTGAVVLTKADVGLNSADNTADSAKPVSTAQQTALDLKAPLASPALTGTPTVPTAAVDTNTTQAASTAWVNAQLSGTLPLMNGTATVGSGTRSVRGNHVHPTDTTKQDVLVSGTTIKTVDGQSLLGAGNIAPTILLVTAPIAIRITGAAGAGTNYQTKLTIGESGGATGANFNLLTAAGTFPAGKNGTCSFLFWDSTGSVPFWVEKITGTAPNRVAHVWVLPNIDLSSGTQTVFLTTAATNMVRSSGDVVFTFFDDFDGASVDTAKWDTSVLSGQTLASSVLSFGGGSTARKLLTLNTLGDGVEIMALLRASDTAASTSNFGFMELATSATTFHYRNVWDSSAAVMVGNTVNTLANNIDNGAGVRQLMRIGRAGGAGRFTSESPANSFSPTSGVPTAATKCTIFNVYDNFTEIDWVAVKKFVAAEPVFVSAVQ